MKFFNSDKSGFLSFVAKRMKALFALLFIIAGVQTLSAASVKGSWDGWQNHDLIHVADNEYYVDIEMTNAATDEFGIDFNGRFYSLSNHTITNWCSLQKFYTNNSNCEFTHNKGTYRFRVWDDGNEMTLTITGIIVTIDEPVQNADGTYTITGRFTNANTIEQQKPTGYEIVINYGTTTDNNSVSLSDDGSSFSYTQSFTSGVTYTCFARVIDNKVGANDSESITLAPGQDPTPSFTDLYLRGDQMGWGAQSSDEWKQTSVSSDGNVYTWEWTSAPKTLTGNFKIAALPADGGWDNSNNFGPKDNDVTLSFENGVATVTVWSDGGSKNINTTEQVSKIEFDKADLTVTFYTTEQPTPVFEATITATPGTGNVTLSSTLTESLAGTDLTSATCQFQYKAADADDETYDNMSETASVIYSDEGATRTATLSQSMAAGDYVFRAVWTYNSAEVANAVTETVTIPSDTPTPTDLNLYVRGKSYNDWGYPGEDFKGVTTDGVIYTWNWAESPKKMSGPFKIAYCNIENPDNWNNDLNFGLENEATLNFGADGTWTGTLVKNEFGDMTIDPARNVKKITFKYDTKELLIETETSSSCQDLKNGFTISGQFNVGVSDGGGLYEGTAVESGEADPANGYWSDGARFVQLTANSVTANYFKWECVGYAIDGHAVVEIPKIAWTGNTTTSARAELSKPGTYTFVCKAKCNETDEWTNSAELTITAPAPEMGFNGNIVTNHDWGNPEWAGDKEGGYMPRENGKLVWVSKPFTVDGFGTDNNNYHFVIDQRYKLLGCVKQNGWTENNECNDLPGDGNNKDNKINRSNLTFENVAWDGEQGANFAAINPGNWTAGVNGTQLQLTVTMIGWDSYTVALEEVSQECTTPADNFAISARLNQGAGAPFEGNLVASDSNTATGGYFADGFRTVTLTTTQVADTYEWKLVSYAIDGNAQATADLTALATITNGDAQTATALLSLPGDYTFQCTAACTDGTPVNSATVTISTYPEMGFDGPIGTPASVSENGWNHAWAGTDGLMNRAQGSLTWSKTFIYQNQEGLSDQNCFVVIQRYKLGCIAEASQGWAGFDECGGIDGNKINKQDVEMSGVHLVDPGTLNYNFAADDVSAWTPGVTELTLTVTMRDWDSYTVELAKKQEQIEANYSSNDDTMGTVTMKVGDTPIANGADITAYIGQIVTLTATPASGYKVASWTINGKVTVSDRTTISPTLSGEDLNVVVTFERDCYSGVVYDLNGGGIICADGGSTELSLNTLNNVTYQLYKGDAKYGEAVQGNGGAAKWTISEAGTYTAKAYDSRFEECKEQAIDMKGSAVVTSVTAPKIKVNPGDNVHLTVLQARSFTADVPVDWSIRSLPADTGGDYCKGDGYMISSQTDTSLVAKFLCVGTAKITATMKDPNQNCMAEVTVTQNAAETEACAPEPEDMQ